MSRDSSHRRHRAEPANEVTGAPTTAMTPALEGGLVGYRLLRRIATGERADVYLATAESTEPPGPAPAPAFAPPALGDAAHLDASLAPPAPPLVVVRVYPADVSSESVALEIEAMSMDTGGTLPALYDVASLEDGRCCLAVERIGGVSVSRLLTERTLSAGEAVTILAPIAVTVLELAERGYVHTRLAASDLILDDAGRPRLVSLGALRRIPGHERPAERTALIRSGHEALAELLDDVAAAVRPVGALDAVVDLIRGRLDARPFERCEAELERRLFAAAAPRPISGVDVRVRAARLPSRIGSTPAATAGEATQSDDVPAEPPSERGRGIRGLFGLAQLPDEFGARVATTLDAVPGAGTRARLVSAMRTKRRALTVGGLIGGGALVLMLTLVPPATATDAPEMLKTDVAEMTDAASPDVPNPARSTVNPPAADSGDGDDPVTQTEKVSDQEVPDASGAVGDDPVAATRWLLERRAECFETLDLGCLDAVLQPASAIEAQDRAAMLAARDGATGPDVGFDLATLRISSEMGDAILAVVARATPEREPASLLVVRGEAGWRLREIFD